MEVDVNLVGSNDTISLVRYPISIYLSRVYFFQFQFPNAPSSYRIHSTFLKITDRIFEKFSLHKRFSESSCTLIAIDSAVIVTASFLRWFSFFPRQRDRTIAIGLEVRSPLSIMRIRKANDKRYNPD